MKKTKVIIVALIAGLAFSVSADLTSFRWFNTAAGNLTDNGGASFTALDATVLTYISADNVIDFDDTILLQDTYGDDFLYNDQGNGLAGRLATTLMTEADGGTDYAGMFAYAVVVDLASASFTTADAIAIGTYYTVTGIFGGLTDMDPLAGPSPTADTFNAGVLQTNLQVVPEPATFGLMGIAGLGMFLARKKARR